MTTKTPTKAEVAPVTSTFDLKDVFDNLDVYQIGRIYIKESLDALTSLGFEKESPALFKILKELDTPKNEKTGLTYEQFAEHINKKIEDQSPNGAQLIFDVFVDDPINETVSLNVLKKVYRDNHIPVTDEDIREMIQKTSSNGVNLTFKEYHDFLSNKA